MFRGVQVKALRPKRSRGIRAQPPPPIHYSRMRTWPPPLPYPLEDPGFAIDITMATYLLYGKAIITKKRIATIVGGPDHSLYE